MVAEQMVLNRTRISLLRRAWQTWADPAGNEPFETDEEWAAELGVSHAELAREAVFLGDMGLLKVTQFIGGVRVLLRITEEGVGVVERHPRAFGVDRGRMLSLRTAREQVLACLRPDDWTQPHDVAAALPKGESLRAVADYLKWHGLAEVERHGSSICAKLSAVGQSRRETAAEVDLGIDCDPDVVLDIMGGLGLAEAADHLGQALRAREAGSWSAANGQVRTALESFFNLCAARLVGNTAGSGGKARKALEHAGHATEEEGCWMHGTIAFCGSKGSHAGIADQADSGLKLAAALAVLRYFLMKWEAALGPPES
jgi:hypothetical protein